MTAEQMWNTYKSVNIVSKTAEPFSMKKAFLHAREMNEHTNNEKVNPVL